MKNLFHKFRRDNSTPTAEGSKPPKPKLLENPRGISTVYTPAGPHKVDIIFTHGLGGGSRKTWAHDPCDYSTFWPGEWLPHEEGFADARIHTFGYNANFQTGATTYAILDFAREFIQELWVSPLNFGNVPIILVGHSMGGLVIKEMYILAVNNERFYHRISSAIKAMLFLAVPHKGSGHSKSLNKILRMVPDTAPQEYINDLKISSITIRTINELFKAIVGDMMMASLYEVIPMKLAPGYHRMIVDPGFAVLNLKNEIIRPVSANHRTICKFSSHDDPNYAVVRGVLAAMVSHVVVDERRGKFAERSSLGCRANERFAVPLYKSKAENTDGRESHQVELNDLNRAKGKGKELTTTGNSRDDSPEGGIKGLPQDPSTTLTADTPPTSIMTEDNLLFGPPDPVLGKIVVEKVGSCKHCAHCKENKATALVAPAQAPAPDDSRG